MITNTNIVEIKELFRPMDIVHKYNIDQSDSEFICKSRKTIESILQGEDTRLLVIVGPCSIHDYNLAIEYAKWLSEVQTRFPHLFLVMRVYFEKPRTRKGWKGFIYDPDLDDSFQIDKGLDLARKLLLEITKMRVPIGSEFLDAITPQYLADLISWGAIGARTSESQIHRQLASGLSMPVGFKNLTSGDYEKAIDGIISARNPHNFLGIDDLGKASHVITKGNKHGHLILRGGLEPNYSEQHLENITASLKKENISTGFIVDCSHGNSKKEYNRQILVALYIKRLFFTGKYPIRGIMLESNLKKGNQPLCFPLLPGVSITDACIDVETTGILLSLLNNSSYTRLDTVEQVRDLLRKYDFCIYDVIKKSSSSWEGITIPIDILESKFHIESDEDILKTCKGLKNEELLLMLMSMRTSFACRLAELKFLEKPCAFLQSDPMNLITDRELERDIVRLFPDPLFLRMIEISKQIQIGCLEQITGRFRLGYLFGVGTFSHEAVLKFSCIHVSYPDYAALNAALTAGEIDAMLVPTYNSLIGEVLPVDSVFKKCGAMDHTIRLCLFSNVPGTNSSVCKRLYVESHILKECKKYIDQCVKYSELVIVENSKAGCLACIRDDLPAFTISSCANKSNFLKTLDENIVSHNITTFSFVIALPKEKPIKEKTPQHQASLTLEQCIDAHCC